MGIRAWLRLQETTAPAVDTTGERETLTHLIEENQHALHTLASLQREDRGWMQLTQQASQTLSRDGLRQISDTCRAMHILSPLIKRGIALRAAYVWGQGVGVTARANGTEGTQDVNTVVQAFLDDPGNRRNVTGAQAHVRIETQLGTDGNVFIACFTNPKTGFVSVRTIDTDEITDQVANPNDKSETWFYRRDYTEQVIGERTTRLQSFQRTVWYPALGHDPARKPPMIDGHPVMWDAPVYHIRVNEQGQWGIPDALASVPWARAHKEFLEDWATMMKALSRIAWRLSGKKNAAQDARRAMQQAQAFLDGPAGQTAAMDPGTQLEAVPKSGATIDAESGRPLAVMIAAGLGLPVTTLMSDPGQTGARAVAETLNLPTRLEMQARQETHSEAYRAIMNHVIDQAVLAPQGPLTGGVKVDSFTGQREVVLAGDDDRTLDIVWPDLDDTPAETIVQAITTADATQKLPPLVTLRLLLRALKVRDVDEILDRHTDDDGEFIDPTVNIGDQAVRAYQQGYDPAAYIRGHKTTEDTVGEE